MAERNYGDVGADCKTKLKLRVYRQFLFQWKESVTVPQQERSADTINCHLAEGCNADNFHGHARVSNLGPPDY